jgi:hypothetical protein
VLRTAEASSSTHGIEDRPALVEAYYRSQHVVRAFQASVCKFPGIPLDLRNASIAWNFTSPAHAIMLKRMPRIFFDVPSSY